MYRRGANWGNPWERLLATPYLSKCQQHGIHELSSKWPKFSRFECNRWPAQDTKLAALNALDSVVALVSYSDGVELFPGCGTIIESHDNTIIVLTSANLIRRPTSKEFGENVLADNITVYAHSYDGHSYRGGEVCAYDFHYNLAALRFILEIPFLSPFAPAKLARMDELNAGDIVIVTGIYFAEPFEPMIATGEYCFERTKYDCKELFMTNCVITRVTLYFSSFPLPINVLPINVECKWRHSLRDLLVETYEILDCFLIFIKNKDKSEYRNH